MRATQQHYQQGHPNHGRSASRTSNYSNNPSPSVSPSRGASASLTRSNSNRSNGSEQNAATLTRPSKKSASSSLSKEVEATEQTKPGLITLSKPLDGSDKKGKGKGARGKQQQAVIPSNANGVGEDDKGQRTQRKKKATTGLENVKGAHGEMLSRSAPPTHAPSDGQWEMPSDGAGGKRRGEAEAPLTWQQQMINSNGPPPQEKKKAVKKTGGKKATGGASTPSKESLTWQQELLGSDKPRGPTFDVFTDARDEATFGSPADDRRSKKPVGMGAGVAGLDQGRKRAGSVGDVRHRGQAKGVNANGQSSTYMSGSNSSSGPNLAGMDMQGPSTPNGKFAYAGPNFHNSPSPASLPVPKFLQQKGGSNELPKSPSSLFAREAMLRSAVNESGLSNEGDVSTSSDEGEEIHKQRSARGVTAPPELGSGGDEGGRSVTIESLLAKMMRPAAA